MTRDTSLLPARAALPFAACIFACGGTLLPIGHRCDQHVRSAPEAAVPARRTPTHNLLRQTDYNRPPIPSDSRRNSHSLMTHLDQLEAQSVYILREAFKIDNLAMLWSLGKDSNVVLWLARKAFFGYVRSRSCISTPTEFPEMYAFRDRYAAEWKLNLIREDCPPIEQTDPTLPPQPAPRRVRPLASGSDRGARLQRHHRRHPPRRGKCPGQGAVFSSRGESGQWDCATSRRSSGTIIRIFRRNASAGPSAAALDRARHLALHQARGIPLVDLFSPKRQALSLPRRRRHHLADGQQRRHLRRHHRRARCHHGARSGPAVPWTTTEDAFERLRASGYM